MFLIFHRLHEKKMFYRHTADRLPMTTPSLEPVAPLLEATVEQERPAAEKKKITWQSLPFVGDASFDPRWTSAVLSVSALLAACSMVWQGGEATGRYSLRTCRMPYFLCITLAVLSALLRAAIAALCNV